MRDIFDTIVRDGEAALLRMIEQNTVESVSLDFKCKADPSNGRFAPSDRQQLGRLISGFANSSGGIGIWGVDARKGADGLDCAQSLQPIENIDLFCGEAQTLSGHLLMPRHDGIRLHSIPASSGRGGGYLAVNVERSERRPHRSEASGDKQYYKRAGDSFFAMEHYDIEDAFRREAAPQLDFTFKATPSIRTRSGSEIQILVQAVFWLRNTSEIMCRYPYAQVQPLAGGVNTNLRHSLPPSPPQDGWYGYYGGADNVVHPGHAIPVSTIYTQGTVKGLDCESISIGARLRFGGQGVRLQERIFTLKEEQIQDLIRSELGIQVVVRGL